MNTMTNGNPFSTDDSEVMPPPRDALDRAAAAMPHGMIRTQTEYQTALSVTKPRDLKDVERRVLEEASRMGSEFVYRWRQKCKTGSDEDEGDGKTTIEGMSIDGAMVLARNWGNCAVPVRLEQETDTHFLIRADFIDLETGFSFPRLYRQRKSGGPGGRMDDERKEDISFQIGMSKAQRNVVDKALPFWLRERAINAAKSAAAQKYADVKAWAPRVLLALQKTYGIDEQRVVARMRKPPEQWTPYDILTLDIIFRSIKDKETSADEEFPALASQRAATTAIEDDLRSAALRRRRPAHPKPEHSQPTTAPGTSGEPQQIFMDPPRAAASMPGPVPVQRQQSDVSVATRSAGEWNSKYPVGTPVWGMFRDGEKPTCTTEAARTFGDSAIIIVESPGDPGMTSMLPLSDVRPRL